MLDFGLASSVCHLPIAISCPLMVSSFELLPYSIRDFPALGEFIGDRTFHPVLICSKATVAEKHGQRAVLLISLIGSAVTCFLFGTSTTMNEALVIRLLQGTFAGAIGVARGTVAVITDQTNEGRAWAVLG
jgi:MFS family permease